MSATSTKLVKINLVKTMQYTKHAKPEQEQKHYKLLFVSQYLWEEFYAFPITFEDLYEEGDEINSDDFQEFTDDDVEKAVVYRGMIYAQLAGYVATDDKESADSDDGFAGGYDMMCVPQEFISECDSAHLCLGWDYIVSNKYLKRKREKILV
jgi:hypothetical protein